MVVGITSSHIIYIDIMGIMEKTQWKKLILLLKTQFKMCFNVRKGNLDLDKVQIN